MCMKIHVPLLGNKRRGVEQIACLTEEIWG